MPRSSALDQDAAWIMTLWRVLHAQNAAAGEIAADVIANLSQFLPASPDSFGMQPLPSPPCTLTVCPGDSSVNDTEGVCDEVTAQDELEEMCDLQCYDPDDFSIHHYYFRFKGVFYCLDRPAFACLPTAA
jgi:hypothetical protein